MPLPDMEHPETIEDKVARAGELLLKGELDEADRLLREILADLPEHAHALHLAGLIDHRRGRNAEAIATLRRALEIDPDNVAAYNSCGEAYRALGELQAAEACFRQALQLAPGQSEVHLNLGLTLWTAGRRAQAETYFRNVLALGSDSPKAHFYLGQLQLEDEDPRAAEQSLRRALELQPGHAEARVYLGRTLAVQGRTREAASVFGRAIDDHPSFAAAHCEAARAAFELCEEAPAVEHLERAISLGFAPAGLSGAGAATGRIMPIEAWCDRRPADYVRVARPQRHNIAQPRVLPQDEHADAVALNSSSTGDIFVARVSDARVLPGELLVTAPDGALFLDGLVNEPLKRAHTSRFIVHASDDGRVLMALPRDTAKVDSPCVLLGAASGHFEWIFECLARLWVLRQRSRLEKLPLLVQSGLTNSQKEMLRLLGYGNERLIEAPANASLLCRELQVVSLVSVGHFIAPFAIEHLRREFRNVVAPRPEAPRRLYLSRAHLASRRLANEDELAPLLARYGFCTVHAEEMSMEEQLGLLQSAEAVIGVEGAAMAHLFFAPPHSRVGLIVARGTESPRYYGPSAPLGHDFTFLLGRPDYASNAALQECDVVLEPGTLEAFLSRL